MKDSPFENRKYIKSSENVKKYLNELGFVYRMTEGWVLIDWFCVNFDTKEYNNPVFTHNLSEDESQYITENQLKKHLREVYISDILNK